MTESARSAAERDTNPNDVAPGVRIDVEATCDVCGEIIPAGDGRIFSQYRTYHLYCRPGDRHQSQLQPAENKFHLGNGDDGKHYWLTPPDLYAALDAEFHFNFDPCPHPLPDGFDGLTCEWGSSNYVNPPFGSIIHQGRKKGPTAWVRKALAEQAKGKRVVLVYPVDKWVLMLVANGATVRNLGDVRWLATEDGSVGKGTGRHIACFVLEPFP